MLEPKITSPSRRRIHTEPATAPSLPAGIVATPQAERSGFTLSRELPSIAAAMVAPIVLAARLSGSASRWPWERVRSAAGLEGVRIHDVRHTFASFGAGASLGLPRLRRGAEVERLAPGL